MKHCISCKESKNLELFYRKRIDQRQSECIDCTRTRRAKWWKSEKGKLSSKNTKLKSRFGITLDEWNLMREKCNNKCEICGEETTLCVDHDHNTGAIRGLLCSPCNLGIGKLKDNKETLLKAMIYLSYYETKALQPSLRIVPQHNQTNPSE